MPAQVNDRATKRLPVDGRKEARLLAIVTGVFFLLSLFLNAIAD